MCKVQEFDKFFVSEYDYLRGFAKSIDPKSDYEGLLHDVYCRCKDRIQVAGFTGETFLNFTRVSLMNTYKSNYRLQQKRPQVNYDNENYQYSIESKLQSNYEIEEQEKEYQSQVSYLNTMIFCYIDEYYSDQERFVFKTYFLLKPKKLNYRTLSQATGYSITSVSNIIKRMKKDIKANLLLYINGTIGRSETSHQ